MPAFVVRVGLPDKPSGDYKQLHRHMRAASYFRVIEGRKGWWHLPHGEYYCNASYWTIEEIRDEVLSIAQQSHIKPRILVNEASQVAWVNLRAVTISDPAPDDT